MNNEPLLITEAGVAYLATQLKAYTDAKVEESRQTAIIRSGSKWKDLVDAINSMLGTSFTYDEDIDNISDALNQYAPNPVPTGIELWDGGTTLSVLELMEHPENIRVLSSPTMTKLVVSLPRVETLSLPLATSIPSFRDNIYLSSVYLPILPDVPHNCFGGCNALREVELPFLNTGANYLFLSSLLLEKVKLPGQRNALPYSTFSGCSSLRMVYAPRAAGIGDGNTFQGTTELRSLTIWQINSGTNFRNLSPSTKFYRLCIKNGITISYNLGTWNPTTAIDATRSDLVTQEEWDTEYDDETPVDCSQFSNNREKFLYFFRNVFMVPFQTVSTTCTLTLKSTIYDVIVNEQDIMDSFANMNWTVARVA